MKIPKNTHYFSGTGYPVHS